MAGNCQAKPCAFAGSSVVCLVEAFKDTLEIVRRDTYAVIGDRENHFLLISAGNPSKPCLNVDLPTRVCEFD